MADFFIFVGAENKNIYQLEHMRKLISFIKIIVCMSNWIY